MQRRNFTLLIIVLVGVAIVASLFLYSQKDPSPPGGEDGGGTNFFSQFNPFGGNNSNPPSTNPPVDVSGYVPTEGGEIQVARLRKVSSIPVAGFAAFPKERLKEVPVVPPETAENKTPTPPATEFATNLRYVARETGNIFQTFADKIEERKFLDITIPQVYEAYFGNHGESVIMRYLGADEKTIETFTGTLPKEQLGGDTTTTKFKGSFLPSNILDMSVSPDTSKIFYLFESGNGVAGITLNLLDNKRTQIFDSAFTEWNPWWGSEKTITLTTKPSAGVPGFAYSLGSTGGNPAKILGNVNGLTTLMSTDGKTLLYGDSNLSLFTYDLASGSSSTLGVKTLPEKCVWGKVSDTVYCAVPGNVPFGAYPDAWYQGEVSFSDQIWKINIKNGVTNLLVDPVTATLGEEIDGIKLALDENEDYLFFVNKKDSFLWELNLK